MKYQRVQVIKGLGFIRAVKMNINVIIINKKIKYIKIQQDNN